VLVAREVPAGWSPVETAVRALVAGPTAEEAQEGLTTNLPADVKVVRLAVSGDTVAVDLSPEILNGLNEAVLREFRAVSAQRWVTIRGSWLSASPARASCSLPTCRRRSRWAPLPGARRAGSRRPTPWRPRRPEHHHRAFPRALLERLRLVLAAIRPLRLRRGGAGGHHSIRLMQFLYQYLTQDGATVHVPRELNESNCCHSATGPGLVEDGRSILARGQTACPPRSGTAPTRLERRHPRPAALRRLSRL